MAVLVRAILLAAAAMLTARAAEEAAAAAAAPAAAEAAVQLDLPAADADESFLQASSKARFSATLAAQAHSHAMWRFGGNYQPQVRASSARFAPANGARACSHIASDLAALRSVAQRPRHLGVRQ